MDEKQKNRRYGSWGNSPQGPQQKRWSKNFQYGSYDNQHRDEEKKIDVNKILNLSDESVEEFIKTAEECAKNFENISTSKIRDFFDYVKSMDKFDKVKLWQLKPKMAYAVGRAEKDKGDLEKFKETMEELINNIKDEKQFDNFVKFFEAIIAYHKIHSKK